MSEIADPGGVPASRAAVSVRALSYSDLPSVLSIERRAFGTPWSMAMFVLELSKPAGICLAAEDEGGMRGFLICSRHPELWHLMNVAVDPERRREGVATALIGSLFARIGEDARVMLEVRESNLSAIAMYERLGFRAAGHRNRYYQDNGENAVIMERRS